MTYFFKSSITKAVLPTGYVNTDMVTREQVPIFLERIRGRAKIDGGEWVDTLVWSMLTNHSWTPQTVMGNLEIMCEDIQALMDILVVRKS